MLYCLPPSASFRFRTEMNKAANGGGRSFRLYSWKLPQAAVGLLVHREQYEKDFLRLSHCHFAWSCFVLTGIGVPSAFACDRGDLRCDGGSVSPPCQSLHRPHGRYSRLSWASRRQKGSGLPLKSIFP
jgi:hypothetical protein